MKETFKNITLYETPEEDEVKSILRKKQKIWFLLFILLPLFTLSFVFLAAGAIVEFSIFISISGLATIIIIPICVKHLSLYKKLLKVARMNDRIRHEARLWFKENKRLSEMQSSQSEELEKTFSTLLENKE